LKNQTAEKMSKANERAIIDAMARTLAQSRYEAYCLFEFNEGLANVLEREIARLAALVNLRSLELPTLPGDKSRRQAG
jgi:hypothetical protein